jgi:hypothetical protein
MSNALAMPTSSMRTSRATSARSVPLEQRREAHAPKALALPNHAEKFDRACAIGRERLEENRLFARDLFAVDRNALFAQTPRKSNVEYRVAQHLLTRKFRDRRAEL